jgi:hypothetical protein
MRPNRLLPALAVTALLVIGVFFGSVAAPAMHLGAFAAAAAKPSPSASANPQAANAAKAKARCDAFVNDLAGKLKTSSANLKAQVKAAIDDQIDQAVKDKTLTQAQADALKKKVAASQGCQGLPSLTAPRRGFGRGMEALKDVVGAAASALNLTPAALQADIMAGKTLQSVAPAGMTQQAFDTAFTAALKKVLDPKVTAKTITATQETAEVNEAVKIADKLWSTPMTPPGGFGGKRGFGRPGPGGPPGAAPTIQ